jgi:hypothetical protein
VEFGGVNAGKTNPIRVGAIDDRFQPPDLNGVSVDGSSAECW